MSKVAKMVDDMRNMLDEGDDGQADIREYIKHDEIVHQSLTIMWKIAKKWKRRIAVGELEDAEEGIDNAGRYFKKW